MCFPSKQHNQEPMPTPNLDINDQDGKATDDGGNCKDGKEKICYCYYNI